MSEVTGYGGLAHHNPREPLTDERSDRIRRSRSSQPHLPTQHLAPNPLSPLARREPHPVKGMSTRSRSGSATHSAVALPDTGSRSMTTWAGIGPGW